MNAVAKSHYHRGAKTPLLGSTIAEHFQAVVDASPSARPWSRCHSGKNDILPVERKRRPAGLRAAATGLWTRRAHRHLVYQQCGENIYPRKIEAVLFSHPGIAEVAVFGVADRRPGEQIAARIKSHAYLDVDADGIREFCRDNIAHYKIPR